MKELVDQSRGSYESIRKLIRGKGQNSSYHGLLEKCPAITYLNRTDVTDNGSKSQLVYVWNDVLYRVWSSGGGCWLSGDGNGNGNGDGNGTQNYPKHTYHDDSPSGSKAGTPDLITGATGECQKPSGEKFSPPNEEQNEEYSKNNKNNNSCKTAL